MLLVLALLACKPDPEVDQPAAWVDDSLPTGIEVVPSIGPAPHAALIRSVNALGAAVPSQPSTLSVDGAERPVDFDGAGYGELLFDVPGSFSVEDALGTVQVHATRTPWEGLGAWPAQLHELEPRLAVPATGGALIVAGAELWWTSATESFPVLRMPDATAIDGVRTAHLDADGILDALAWAGGRLVLLKGRLGGGMSWAGTLEGAEGYRVAGADAADLNQDGLSDLAVAWQGARTHPLQILEGDGLWGFTPVEPRYLLNTPWDLVLGDNTGEGIAQITIPEEGGRWERFRATELGDYLAVGPSLDTSFPDESTALSGFDLLGEGSDQLFIIAPWSAGASRLVWAYDLYQTNPQYLLLDTPAARLSYADADGDGLVDLWMHYEDGELVLLKSEDGAFRQRKVATLDVHGPLVSADLLGDSTPDALVASERAWTVWQGQGPADEESPWWRADEPSWGALAETRGGPMARAGEDLAAVVDRDGELRLRVWEVVPGDPATLSEVSMVRLGTYSDDARDLAVCDGVAWVLAPSELIAVDIDKERVLGRVSLSGSRVDCGEGPDGAAAVVLEEDTAALFDADLQQVGSEEVGSAEDVALVDLGSGPELGTCSTAPCRAERWVWGDAGEQALVVGDAQGLHLDTASGELELAGQGQVSIADVDGDGHDDLLAVDGGLIVIHRSTGQGIGPAEAWHTRLDLEAPLLAADADGDGLPEVWAWSGSDVVYSP